MVSWPINHVGYTVNQERVSLVVDGRDRGWPWTTVILGPGHTSMSLKWTGSPFSPSHESGLLTLMSIMGCRVASQSVYAL